jgi:hypothetical protein
MTLKTREDAIQHCEKETEQNCAHTPQKRSRTRSDSPSLPLCWGDGQLFLFSQSFHLRTEQFSIKEAAATQSAMNTSLPRAEKLENAIQHCTKTLAVP